MIKKSTNKIKSEHDHQNRYLQKANHTLDLEKVAYDQKVTPTFKK